MLKFALQQRLVQLIQYEHSNRNKRVIKVIEKRSNAMKIFLELIRILFIFIVFGFLMWGVVKLIYSTLQTNIDNDIGWFPGIAIYIILFVLYRNKLQFSGFYEGPNQKKLSKKITLTLISCSILLLIVPTIIK